VQRKGGKASEPGETLPERRKRSIFRNSRELSASEAHLKGGSDELFKRGRLRKFDSKHRTCIKNEKRNERAEWFINGEIYLHG